MIESLSDRKTKILQVSIKLFRRESSVYDKLSSKKRKQAEKLQQAQAKTQTHLDGLMEDPVLFISLTDITTRLE